MLDRRFDPYNFGSLMEEIFTPVKYGRRTIDQVGTLLVKGLIINLMLA